MNRKPKPDRNRRLYEALLNDRELQQLNSQRFKIYMMSVPRTYLNQKGDIVCDWIDERNSPRLLLIENSIKLRFETIKQEIDKR